MNANELRELANSKINRSWCWEIIKTIEKKCYDAAKKGGYRVSYYRHAFAKRLDSDEAIGTTEAEWSFIESYLESKGYNIFEVKDPDERMSRQTGYEITWGWRWTGEEPWNQPQSPDEQPTDPSATDTP